MESTRAEREINNVGNCGDEYRRTFFEKPSGYRVQKKNLVRTFPPIFLRFTKYPLQIWKVVAPPTDRSTKCLVRFKLHLVL